MRPCVIDPCGLAAHDLLPFCLAHWGKLNRSTQNRIYWSHHDWLTRKSAKTASAYHRAVALAVAELTAAQTSVEAGRAS